MPCQIDDFCVIWDDEFPCRCRFNSFPDAFIICLRIGSGINYARIIGHKLICDSDARRMIARGDNGNLWTSLDRYDFLACFCPILQLPCRALEGTLRWQCIIQIYCIFGALVGQLYRGIGIFGFIGKVCKLSTRSLAFGSVLGEWLMHWSCKVRTCKNIYK